MRDSTVIDDFIGRKQELDALAGLFTPPIAQSGEPPRLLTLAGIGGSGKTRLARQFSEQIRGEFADGTTWIDLAPLSDPELVPRAILTALDLAEQPDQSPLETLIAQLAFKQVLLVLDNCEHLLSILPTLCRTLLARCPELTILATSREPLGTADEVVYPVRPLSLPTRDNAEAALNSDAVRLFIARAQQILPGFRPTDSNLPAIVRVCTRLDGLPLAIELAAARVKVMTVTEIAERLNDAFRLLTRGTPTTASRHQTLRAAMDWSYQLLSPAEQTLFRRASIFAGGFTLEAAERVCSDGENPPSPNEQRISPSEILDLLSNLADKSLVVIAERIEQAPTRYRMLEIVRQYAREKMQAAGEETTLGTRHLQWCVALAERAEPELAGAEQARWLAREDSESANFRAALRRASDDDAREQGLRLANALWRYWERRGEYSEAQSWYNRLLTGDLAQTSPRVRGKAMYRLAAMHYHQGQYDEAIRLGEATLPVARELDDRRGMASILNLLGVIATDKGSYDRAIEFYEQALALFQELDDIRNISQVLNNFGNLAKGRGQYRHALQYYESSLVLKRQVGGATAATAIGLNDVGALFLALGEYVQGQAVLQASLAIHRELGDKRGMHLNLTNLGRAALYLGDYATAHTLLHEAEQVGTESENKGDLAYGVLGLGELAQAQGEYAQAQSLYEKALGLCRGASEHVSVAQVLHHLAKNALESGKVNAGEEYGTASLKLYQQQDHKPGMAAGLEVMAGVSTARQKFARAVQFLGAATLLRKEAETPPHPHESAELEKIIVQIRNALGERGFNAGLQRGRTLPLSETIADALAASPPRIPAALSALAETPEVQVFGLGQSVVLKEGKALTIADWTYAKSKELFFYFLSRQNASREETGLDLWADASPGQLRRIFHRVLGTLRKALGKNEWITFENDKYALNRALHYSYDVDLFEQHLAEAQRALRAGPATRPQAIAPLQAAVELYHGDFLPDVQGGDWILFRREQLRQKFLQALLLLGQLLSEQNEYARAAAVYERALAHDNFLEVAHRELMRARARQGEVGLALKQYQSLVELLLVEFGAQPAPETHALFERLRKGEQV